MFRIYIHPASPGRVVFSKPFALNSSSEVFSSKFLTPSARFLCSSSIVLFHLPLRILGEPSHGHTSHERDDDEDNPHEVSIQELAVGASSEYAGKCERTDGADAAYQREC